MNIEVGKLAKYIKRFLKYKTLLIFHITIQGQARDSTTEEKRMSSRGATPGPAGPRGRPVPPQCLSFPNCAQSRARPSVYSYASAHLQILTKHYVRD